MEIILSILIVILVFASVMGKNGKSARKGRGGQAPAAKAPEKPAKNATQSSKAVARLAARDARFEKAMQRLEARLNEQPAATWEAPEILPVEASEIRQGEAMLEDPDCAGGSMAHTHAEGHSALEDEDCVGGSMEHVHSEGVSRSDHARRMAAIDAEDAQDVLPETIDARTLRRAVVMAEVLGKPRALRGARN